MESRILSFRYRGSRGFKILLRDILRGWLALPHRHSTVPKLLKKKKM